MSNFSDLNIYEKMLRIEDEIKEIQKSLTIGKGEKQYTAISENDVLSAVKPLEIKYGIYSYPAKRSRNTQIIERAYRDDASGEKSTFQQIVDNIETIYRFVNCDDTSQFIEVTSYGTGIDSGDKAPGKAMTYADKYALMKAYKISGGDKMDPDATESPDRGIVFPTDVFTGQGITPSEDNPMMYDVIEEPANAEPQEEKKMSLEEAKSVVVKIGSGKGKTLGELVALDKGQVEFYAGDTFKNDKYPELKEASKIIIESLNK